MLMSAAYSLPSTYVNPVSTEILNYSYGRVSTVQYVRSRSSPAVRLIITFYTDYRAILHE